MSQNTEVGAKVRFTGLLWMTTANAATPILS